MLFKHQWFTTRSPIGLRALIYRMACICIISSIVHAEGFDAVKPSFMSTYVALQAFRLSVGKLGIIARLKMRVVKEIPVKRTLKALTPVELLQMMTNASDMYQKDRTWPEWMNETQIFWIVQKNQVGALCGSEACQDRRLATAPARLASLQTLI